MSALQTNYQTDPVFGRLMQLTNGLIDLRVTLDYGPRVIHASVAGMENLFFQDKEKKALGERFSVYDDQLVLYGGHRIWIAPEIMPRCYHPDNEPVAVTPTDTGVTFAGAVEKSNQIQKIMHIQLAEDAPTVKISHSILNTGLWEIELAPWCITMLAAGGYEVLPMPNRKTGLLNNRNFSLWDYSIMNDARVYWGKDFITLKQDPSAAHPFKLGYNNEAGWAAYFNKGQVFVKFFEPSEDGFYPDDGCCFESYTNGSMLEMETLGEFVQLSPDEAVSHTEEWEFYKADFTPTNDETLLQEAVKPFII
jgi:hypothetical protein